jgi:hypothetical protein
MIRMRIPKRAIFLVALLLVTLACEEKPENPGLPVLTVEVETNAFSRNKMKWIYISEPGGKILDGEIVHAGTFTLNAAVVPEYVDVTIYTITDFGGQRSHDLVTVRNIPKGQTMKFNREMPVMQLSTGRMSFEISNWNLGNAWSNNFFASPGATSNIFFPELVGLVGNKLLGTVRLFSENANVLFVLNRDNRRLHHWATGVKPNDQVKLDIENFAPFDQYVSLPNKANSGQAWGYKGTSKYHFGNIAYEPDRPGPSLGYLHGFDQYETIVANSSVGLYMNYVKKGSLPESVSFPAHAGTFASASLSKVSYQSAVAYDYYSAFFIGWTIPLRWQVIGGDGEFRITEFPKELKESFKDFATHDVRFDNFELRKRLDGYTYDQFIFDFLNGNAAPQQYEFYQIFAYP